MKCSFCGSTDNKLDVIQYDGRIVIECDKCKSNTKENN